MDYRLVLSHFVDHPRLVGALTHLRGLTIQGVRAGALSIREMVYEVRPAAVAVSLLAEREVAATGAALAGVIGAAARLLIVTTALTCAESLGSAQAIREA